MNCRNCNDEIDKKFINTEFYSCGFCSLPCFVVFVSSQLLEFKKEMIELQGLLSSKIVWNMPGNNKCKNQEN